jgi:hypothetical protein
LPRTGGCAWFIVTVVVAVLLFRVPSVTTQEIVRFGSAPELLGFWFVEE